MRVAIIIVAGLLSIFSFPVAASQWHLIMIEKSELYSAVVAYRVETTLIQTAFNQVTVWVRTDFLRPTGYEYPKQPRIKDGHLSTDAFIWQKERYVVDCKSQQMKVTDGSYMLANENIEWNSDKPRTVGVSPDTIFDVVFKLVCSSQQARPSADIQSFANSIEKRLLPDPQEQERIREEKIVPRLQI